MYHTIYFEVCFLTFCMVLFFSVLYALPSSPATSGIRDHDSMSVAQALSDATNGATTADRRHQKETVTGTGTVIITADDTTTTIIITTHGTVVASGAPFLARSVFNS